ncbi:hypothetical protein DdX_21795 [Ditylenchus destructor]|uniref:Uncharacterized protein n=1 Tax=Ditylenchus destructor TaxID=166010 RepID=A0AAD4MEE1_9BILA|nr:hypothetical protein DdX_21795 [Ditylenchus destructor]
MLPPSSWCALEVAAQERGTFEVAIAQVGVRELAVLERLAAKCLPGELRFDKDGLVVAAAGEHRRAQIGPIEGGLHSHAREVDTQERAAVYAELLQANVGERGVVQDIVGERGMTQVGAGEIHAGHVAALEHDAVERRAGHARARQLAPAEDAFDEQGRGQVRVGEAALVELLPSSFAPDRSAPVKSHDRKTPPDRSKPRKVQALQVLLADFVAPLDHGSNACGRHGVSCSGARLGTVLTCSV